MLDDPIKHVIVLMLENRSFDHMLGALNVDLPGLDGLDDTHPRTNIDREGRSYQQVRGASPTVRFDPKHELEHVLAQLGGEGSNAGFVNDFEAAYPTSTHDDRSEVMKVHENLPALQDLARNFLVCDRWFASVPGPTWANRFFVHSGTSLGRVSMPGGALATDFPWYDQKTIYDRLNEGGKRWRIYYGDIPQSLLLVRQLEPHNAANYWNMTAFSEHAAGPEDQFPDYCFIEPTYYGPTANDDHPLHDVAGGDQLIADVYNAVRANPALWASSLLVVLFDEHGGFYDHVSPPKTVPPDAHLEEYTFDRLGVRVPALLVSPYVGISVNHTEFDHTSLLKYLVDKWNLGSLGARTAQANSIKPLIGDVMRRDTMEAVGPKGPEPHTAAPPEPSHELNSHQSALIAVAKLVEAADGVAASDLKHSVEGKTMVLDKDFRGAIAKVEAFLANARTSQPGVGKPS